jgi:hypothetical protein
VPTELGMTRPEIKGDSQRFVPPSAQFSAAAGIASMIVTIAAMTFTWLCFETSSPAIAIACGLAAGGLCLAGDRWRRQKLAPPSLLVNRIGIAIVGRGQRRIIQWSELIEVRLVDEDVERLEFHWGTGIEPAIIVVDDFTREQAAEIKRVLLRSAA